MPSTEQAFRQFDHTLQTAGLRPALAALLAQTDYRFIAIFRTQGDWATAAVYVDLENPAQERIGESPAAAIYCNYVRTSRGVFSIVDAMADERLVDHPKREEIRGYCGVPVMDADGEILGTLCCYDVVPRDPAQLDLELMLQVASRLALGGFVPPYPRAA